MENLIEELTKVNPSNLSEEGLKLFNTINEIIDKNKDLEEEREVHAETISELEKENKKLAEAICNEYELARTQTEYEVNECWKSLIKEKIEELDKQRIKMEKDDIGVGFTLGKEWSDLKAKIQVLEELLKGE